MVQPPRLHPEKVDFATIPKAKKLSTVVATPSSVSHTRSFPAEKEFAFSIRRETFPVRDTEDGVATALE